MPRVVKLPADRQDQILDVAQRLFWTRGYDATPIQAIIDEVGIAKGTFYHHYRSKEALLEALVDRMVAQSLVVMAAVADDPTLRPLDKLNALFHRVGAWKAERKEILIELHRVMRSDANMPLMARLGRESVAALAPLLGEVIADGVREGVFDTRYPVQAGAAILALGTELSRAMGESLLGLGPPLSELGPNIDAYHDAVERILGAAPGSIRLVDRGLLKQWLQDEPGRCA